MTSDPARALEVARKIADRQQLTFVGPCGEGAFKHVFQVTLPGGEAYALKLFKSATLTERTAREVESMKRCKHPNIARVPGSWMRSWRQALEDWRRLVAR